MKTGAETIPTRRSTFLATHSGRDCRGGRREGLASRSVPQSQPRLARRSAKPFAAGRFIFEATSPWKIWRAYSMRTYAAGSITTAGSTPLRFIPLCGASMSSWRDGPTGSSSPYTGTKRGPSIGCSALRAVKRGCSLIGACFSDAAGQWEPYEARVSRTVLRAPGGETPPGDSPHRRLSARARGEGVPAGFAGAFAQVRIGVASGQDPADPLWPPRGQGMQGARGGEARNLRLPRLHAFLHAIEKDRGICYRAQDDQETDGG